MSGIRPAQFLDGRLLRYLRVARAAGKEVLMRLRDGLVPDLQGETNIYDLPYLWALLLDTDSKKGKR